MKKKKRKYEEVNYWETMADSLIALLLCILLIALLLVLYLVRMPEEHIDDETESYTDQYAESSISDDDDDHDDDDDDHGGYGGWGENGQGGNQGAGGSEGGGGGKGENPYEYDHPGIADGEGNGKAAVFVEIIDGETNRVIKYEGVEFELYDLEDDLQILSTYYPEKIDFKKFITDEEGTFYLPEKIVVQHYYLHALTRVPGYDYPEDTELLIEDGYEWNEPYTAKVVMFPEKNVIRLRLRDYNTGKTLTGSTFDIVAAEDITTKDGTIRCKEGDIVDTIVLDEDGYGESRELYLGRYLVQQVEVPQYYAKILVDTEVAVESKAKTTETKVVELREEKTKANVVLFDELYVATYLQNAEFTLLNEAGEKIASDITNDKGKLTFTNLMKDTTYYLRQDSTVEGYRITSTDQSFTVDVNGLIAGEADYDCNVSNRMIRIAIGLQDMLFRGQVSDVNIGVMNSDEVVVKAWSTTAIEQTLESLEPGEYLVVIAGNQKGAKRIKVEDTAEIQTFQFSKWTTTDIGVLLALLLVLIVLLICLIIYLIHRARKKAEEKEQNPDLPVYEDTLKNQEAEEEVKAPEDENTL